MSTLLDSLRVTLGLETKGFAAGRSAVRSLTTGVRQDIATLKAGVAGYFSASFARELTSSVIEMTGRYKDLSEQSGKTLADIQKWDLAFKRVGASGEDALAAFEILTQKRRKALEEGGADAELFSAFGVSEEELKSLEDASELFKRLGKGRSATSQGDRELFGQMFGTKRGGKMLAGALALEEVKDFKLISDSDIESLDKASKEFSEAMRQFQIASVPFVTTLVSWLSTAQKFWAGSPVSGDSPENADPAQVYAMRREAKILAEKGSDEAWDIYKSTQGNKLGVQNFQDISEARTVNKGEYERMYSRLYKIRTGKDLPGTFFAGSESSGPGYNEMVESINAQGGGRGGSGVSPWSVDRKKINDKLQDAVFGSVFKLQQPEAQKKAIELRMQKLADQAAAEKDPLKRADLQAEVIKLAGERGGMERNYGTGFKADSLASIGGFIGGAAAGIDPSLAVAQDQLNTMKGVLAAIRGLPPEIGRYVSDAASGRPIDDL